MPPESEVQLHTAVCDYIRIKHKEVIFRTDHAAGMKLSKAQAVRHSRLQQSRAYPDLFIAEPRAGYHGLFIEIKRENTTIFKQNGELVANQHIKEQAFMLQKLIAKGYLATFGVGFDHIVQIIDEYLGLPAPSYQHPEFTIPLPKPKKTSKTKSGGELF